MDLPGDPQAALARFAEARSSVLATRSPEGRARLVPVCHALAGGRICFAVDDVKPKRSARLARLDDIRGDPRVTLLASHYDDSDWTRLWWVRVYGSAAELPPGAAAEAALAALAAKYPQYAAQPPPGPVVAVTVEAVRGWQA